MPRPGPPDEENMLHFEANLWSTMIGNYAEKHCTEKGDPKNPNKTRSQQLGAKKLKKRSDTGEIVISRD